MRSVAFRMRRLAFERGPPSGSHFSVPSALSTSVATRRTDLTAARVSRTFSSSWCSSPGPAASEEGQPARYPPQLLDPRDRRRQRQVQAELGHDPVPGREHPPGRDQDLQQRVAQLDLEDEPPAHEPETLDRRARGGQQRQQRRGIRPGIRIGLADQHRDAGPERRAPRRGPGILPGQQGPLRRRREVRLALHPERKRARLEAGRGGMRRPRRAIVGVAPHVGPGMGALDAVRDRRLAATHGLARRRALRTAP